jgi:DNA-binding PucR family transcriptional regulator
MINEDDQEDLDKKSAGLDYLARKSLNYGRHAKLIKEKDAEIKQLREENSALKTSALEKSMMERITEMASFAKKAGH